MLTVCVVSMRKRLQDCLALELSKVKTAEQADVWPRWNFEHFVAADSFRYQYSELSEELILHDVYLNNFVAADEVYLDGIDMASFSEALLISIQSNENVLRILQQVRMGFLWTTGRLFGGDQVFHWKDLLFTPSFYCSIAICSAEPAIQARKWP